MGWGGGRIGGLVVVFGLMAGCQPQGCSTDPGTSPTTTKPPAATASTTRPTTSVPTTTVPAGSGGGAQLVTSVCAGTTTSPPRQVIDDARLIEVSGVAVAGGRTWVLNDGGSPAELYGIGADGSVQTVAVSGVTNNDWEDLGVVHGSAARLWISDLGANNGTRPDPEVLRVPVPAAGATEVTPDRLVVRYPGEQPDVEGIVVDPAGPVYLLTKEPARSEIYRLDPPATGGGTVQAKLVGEFRPGEGPASMVTGASLSADRRALAVRTYGAVWIYPVAPGQDLAAALQDEAARCRGPVPLELQGEAVAFVPDQPCYVTIPEGQKPAITRVCATG